MVRRPQRPSPGLTACDLSCHLFLVSTGYERFLRRPRVWHDERSLMAKKSKPRPTAATAANGSTSDFNVLVKFEPRLITEHLGRDKYATSAQALTELVTNAFDAEASLVDVDVLMNGLDAIVALTVFDTGVGMTRVELTDRFGLVGVRSDNKTKIGRFGVGRWGVFRLGRRSQWRTVAKDTSGVKHRLSFVLEEGSPNDFVVRDEMVDPAEPTGTWIQVEDLYEPELLRQGRVTWDLAVQLCGYLLAHPQKSLRVNNTPIVIDILVASREVEKLVPDHQNQLPAPVTLTHLMLRNIARNKFKAQLLLTAQGMTVQAIELADPPSPNYVGLAESPYFEEMVTSNRAAFVDFDDAASAIRQSVISRVHAFGERLQTQLNETFIERARAKPFYPYKAVPRDSIDEIHQRLYDATLEALNRVSNLEIMKQQHQQIVFGLLHRALSNGDLLHVLSQVATLSDDEMAKFRDVLERTTIQALLDLASQVQQRLDFLDMLHELVYGSNADKVLERTQLHKYLETQAWIFGPQFHLATSDKKFRTVIARHRALAGLPDVPDDSLATIRGIEQVPDLFLAAQKEFPANDGSIQRCLLVELKRPSVDVGFPERTQLEKYANVILDSGEFGGDRTHFDLFVVSANIGADVRRSITQPGLPAGCFATFDRARLFARTWGDVIESARSELHLVRDRLRQKSLEIAVPEYFDKMFPHVKRSDGAP